MFGGVLVFAASIVTVRALDHPDDLPLLSVAFAFTRYDPELLQLCEAIAVLPELTKFVSDIWPSSQSKMYLTWSPFGSVVEVTYA